MRLRGLPLLLLAALTPTCVADGPGRNATPQGTAPGSLLSRELPGDHGPLTFPPEDRGRRERPAMGEGPGSRQEAEQVDEAPEVVSPYAPVDLADVHAGDVLRVALLVRRSQSVDADRYGYLAITDRLPAGFEPVQQDLATVAAQPALEASHPLAAWFEQADERASFIEMHDDRVNLYFDEISGDDAVASYLVRATTPGSFAIPPATAELMYEPNSLGATEPLRVAIR